MRLQKHPEMQLRKQVANPKRFDEEDFTIFPSSTPMLQPPKARRSGCPAFPSLLEQIAVEYVDKLPPASFPSKSICQASHYSLPTQLPFGADEQKDQRQDAEQTRNATNSSGQHEEDHCHLPLDTHPEAVVAVEDDLLSVSDTIAEMASSPMQNSSVKSETTIKWSKLEEGLQLYIFDSLLAHYPRVDVVAGILGLREEELIEIWSLRNLKRIHSLSYEQLWRCCSCLSSSKGCFIDPQILKQYMRYLRFAQNLETTTQDQMLLAFSFLHQRGVKARFVDELLPHNLKLWTRPKASPSSLTGDGLRFQEDDPKATSTLSKCTHECDPRHAEGITGLDVGDAYKSFTPLLTKTCWECPYFPPRLFDNRLSKTTFRKTNTELKSIHESNVTTGDMEETSNISPVENCPAQGALSQVILQKLKLLFEGLLSTQFPEPNESMIDDLICLLMHMLTAVAAQNKVTEEEVENMPLSLEEKCLVSEAAEFQIDGNVVSEFKSKLVIFQSFRTESSSSESVSKNLDRPTAQALDSVTSQRFCVIGNPKEREILRENSLPDQALKIFISPDAQELDAYPTNETRNDKVSTNDMPYLQGISIEHSRINLQLDTDTKTASPEITTTYCPKKLSRSSFGAHSERKDCDDTRRGTMIQPPRTPTMSQDVQSPVTPLWSPMSDIDAHTTAQYQHAFPTQNQESVQFEHSLSSRTFGHRFTPWKSTSKTFPIRNLSSAPSETVAPELCADPGACDGNTLVASQIPSHKHRLSEACRPIPEDLDCSGFTKFKLASATGTTTSESPRIKGTKPAKLAKSGRATAGSLLAEIEDDTVQEENHILRLPVLPTVQTPLGNGEQSILQSKSTATATPQIFQVRPQPSDILNFEDTAIRKLDKSSVDIMSPSTTLHKAHSREKASLQQTNTSPNTSSTIIPMKRTRSPRKDKGKKRTTPYNTKRRKIERETAEANTTAMVTANLGTSEAHRIEHDDDHASNTIALTVN